MRKKNIFIIAIASLLLLIGISFSTIILSKKKQNEVLKDYIIDINLISNVHPSLPWQFKSNHSEIKIKPGEVKVVEYEVKNISNSLTHGIASFSYNPKEIGKYINKIKCFCYNKQTLKANEKTKYTLVVMIDPEVTKDAKTKGINKVIIQFTFFDYNKFKE